MYTFFTDSLYLIRFFSMFSYMTLLLKIGIENLITNFSSINPICTRCLEINYIPSSLTSTCWLARSAYTIYCFFIHNYEVCSSGSRNYSYFNANKTESWPIRFKKNVNKHLFTNLIGVIKICFLRASHQVVERLKKRN